MVSVVIPTYNRAATIEKSMRSVLDQSCRDLELIVVDDGSTDNTKEVIQSVQDDRIRYIFQANAGACAARNKGIEAARGEYVAFHDSDDIWLPGKLERQLYTIREKGADILFCQLRRCSEGDGTTILPKMKESGFVAYREMVVGISTQTLFMRKEVAEQVRFDEDMPRLQDLEWLLRAVKQFSLYGMKEVLVDYYFSPDSISVSNRNLLNGISRIHKKNPKLSAEAPKVYQVLRRYILDEGMSKLRKGDPEYTDYLRLGFSMSNMMINK